MGTKTRAYGADSTFRLAFESTYGTLPTDNYHLMLFKSASVGAERPLGYDPLIGSGQRDAQDPHYEAFSVAGEIGMAFDLRMTGLYLKGLFGAPGTTNDAGVYTHLFTSGGDLPSLGLEFGHPKLTAPVFYRYPGGKFDGLKFDMGRTGPAGGTVNVIAQAETEAGSTIDATPTNHVLTRFSRGRGTIKVDGVQLANVTGGGFNFSNHLSPVETIRDDGKIDGVDETESTADGSITVRFSTDTTLADAIDAETPVELEYGFSIPGAEGYALTFHLPRVFLPKKKGEIKGPGGIERAYDWRAAYDSVAGYMLRATLINDVASY